jgi:DNA polymerase (family 10)
MIEDLPEPIDDLLDRHEMDLMQGIGESIETELQALRTTGHSPRHEELLARIGPGVLDLLDISGLGMRRLQVLFQEAGISSIPELKKAAESGQLADLPHFGESVQEKLLSEIEHWEHTRGKRYPLPEAKGLADSIVYQLLELPEVDRAEVAGSIRRGRETIGDIDILVTTDDAALVSDYFKSLPEVVEIVFDGDTRASVRVIGGIQVDLRVLEPAFFGAGLHYFTGSKEHHIRMRIRSKKMGLKISEHGVCRYDDPDEVPVGPMTTEEEVFAAVGLPYIPPEIRMGTDEIEAAERGELPDLVDMQRLRGDVHLHSAMSGGRDDLEALVAEAERIGYEWIVVAERSRGIDPRNGIGDEELKAWLDRAAELDNGSPVRVICGAEVEITPAGAFDLSHRLLAQCDWVIGGIHHDVEEDADLNTQRVIWGIETGILSSLASPTGRRLGMHDGYPLYFDEVVEACIDFGVALEMNGHPSRLDLNAQMAGRVRQQGGMLVVGSEAGSIGAMSNIEYAVQQARRAWMEPDDMLNYRGADDLVGAVRTLINR